jgi:hypothetical protein
MAAPINSPSTGDIWHLCIDDLLAPLPEKARLGGPGPFVINLSASTAPIDLPSGSIAGCQQGHVYQVQRTEDRRLRYRLRFGPIANEEEAEDILEKVRDLYPSALTATADADDLRAIAAIQAKVKPAVKPAEKPAEKVAVPMAAAIPPPMPLPQQPVMQPTPQPRIAEESRQSEMPGALAPPVLSMDQEVIRERVPAASPVVPSKTATAHPPMAAAEPPASTRMIPLLTTVATSSIKRVAAKPAPTAIAAPTATAMPMVNATPTTPVPRTAPVAPSTPTVSAQPAPLPPVEQLSLRSLGLETTQTVRALTAVELEDEQSLRWFVIQLAMADEPFDSESVPNLDIFSLYRLYCVAGIDQGRVVHTLRLGFFGAEIAAGAVASYLAEFYENPTVKRVSVAERHRFADQRFEPRKDVGATGKHAVIEITNERYIREKRVTAAAHPPVSQRSR